MDVPHQMSQNQLQGFWAANRVTGSKGLGFSPGTLEQELGDAPVPATKHRLEPLNLSTEIFNSTFSHGD